MIEIAIVIVTRDPSAKDPKDEKRLRDGCRRAAIDHERKHERDHEHHRERESNDGISP